MISLALPSFGDSDDDEPLVFPVAAVHVNLALETGFQALAGAKQAFNILVN